MNELTQTLSPSKNLFKIKSHKIIRHKTEQKQLANSKKLQPLRKQSIVRARINSMNPKSIGVKSKIRKYTEIQDQCTSFNYSPAKLSPPKQYESQLKLSAQSWALYDMRTQGYKRGWRPSRITKFNGLFKLIVLLVYCELIKTNKNITKIKVKINHTLLKQSKFKIAKKDQKRLKWVALSKKTSKTLSNGTIISLQDIIKAMVISGNQDLFQYCLIFLGVIIFELVQNISTWALQTILSIDQQKKQQMYADQFCKYCNENFFKSLDLDFTNAQNNQQSYDLNSTPNEICKIFFQGFNNHDFFKQVVNSQRIVCPIKYQVGFKYWQDRTLTIKSKKQDLSSDYFCYLVYKGKTNFQAFCYNCQLQIVIVIQDSKFAMADLDIGVLQKWFINVTKSVVDIQKFPSMAMVPPRKRTNIFSVSELPSLF